MTGWADAADAARRVAAALAAAGLSAAASVALVAEVTYDWPGALRLGACLVLVAAATVVGTSWSWRPVGLILGAPPMLYVLNAAVVAEGDAQGGLAVLILLILSAPVSAAAWWLTLRASRRRRSG